MVCAVKPFAFSYEVYSMLLRAIIGQWASSGESKVREWTPKTTRPWGEARMWDHCDLATSGWMFIINCRWLIRWWRNWSSMNWCVTTPTKRPHKRTMMTKGKRHWGKRGTNKHEGTVAELSLDLFLDCPKAAFRLEFDIIWVCYFLHLNPRF